MPPQNPPEQPYPDQAYPGQAYPDQARWNQPRSGYPQTRPVSQPGPAPQPPQPPQPRPAPMSRRSVLRGAVGAGAAAAVGAGAVVAFDRHSGQPTLMPVSKPVAMAPMAPTAMAGPLVVYIADTTTGLLDVFGGTGATQVNNPALVRQLLENLKLA